MCKIKKVYLFLTLGIICGLIFCLVLARLLASDVNMEHWLHGYSPICSSGTTLKDVCDCLGRESFMDYDDIVMKLNDFCSNKW